MFTKLYITVREYGSKTGLSATNEEQSITRRDISLQLTAKLINNLTNSTLKAAEL